jgi:hypothetical protein
MSEITGGELRMKENCERRTASRELNEPTSPEPRACRIPRALPRGSQFVALVILAVACGRNRPSPPPPAPAGTQQETAAVNSHAASRSASPPRSQPAAVQTGTPRAVAAQPRVAPEYRALGDHLAAALQELARAQRRYKVRYWKYAPTLAALVWRQEGDIVLQVTTATADGWAAVAIHRALPSRSCVYYEGSVAHAPTTAAQRRPGVERSVICDSF